MIKSMPMLYNIFPLCFLLVLAIASPASGAESAGAGVSAAKAPADSISRENVANKLNLAKQLLMKNSASLQRIAQSDNPKAKEQIAKAHQLLAKAESEFAADRLAQTAKLIEEALHLVGTATRMVRDPALEASEARTRYARLLEEIHTFQKSYNSLCARLQSKRCIDTDLGHISSSIDEAEALARAGKYGEAAAQLAIAHELVVSTLNKVLESEAIIVYDLKFETPVEEYQHELARFQSYKELIPIAQAELKPSDEKIKLADRFVQQSSDAFDLAQKEAAAENYPAAIKTLQDATNKLQSSLRIIGLVVPQ